MHDPLLLPLELHDSTCADWFVEVLNLFGLLEGALLAKAANESPVDTEAIQE
jgi:hypothetical protein